MRLLWQNFWQWYERYYTLNVIFSSLLFLLQLVHLYWLTAAIIVPKLYGANLFFSPSQLTETLIAIIDYTEIPAIISVSLIYVNDLRKNFAWLTVLFLVLLNSQWLHLFWITDDVVLEFFLKASRETLLPASLAWAAIFIDYLEMPIMFDTIRKSVWIIHSKLRNESII